MRKILTLLLVISAVICLKPDGYGQERYRHNDAGATYTVDYKNPAGISNTYTDAAGNAADYIDAAANVSAPNNFVPGGTGTVVVVDFTVVDIDASDNLEGFRGGVSQGVESGAAPSASNPYKGDAANPDLNFVFTRDGSLNGAGWEANLSLESEDGVPIPPNYTWQGIAQGGSNASFIYKDVNNTLPDAYVFCGFDASVLFVLEDDVDANNIYRGFNDNFGTYEQRLEYIEVNWGDGSPVETFFVGDPAAHRATYESVVPRKVEFGGIADGVTHTYASEGRYQVRINGYDDIGVRTASTANVDVLIEGDAATNVVANDVQICIGDPATLNSEVQWIVADYESRIVDQRWEGVVAGGNPGDAPVILSQGQDFLNISPDAYRTDPDPADADLTDGFRDYTFTHYATFDNGCTEQVTTVNYRVYKEPEAGSEDLNADNIVCETETSFDLNTLLTGQDLGGIWYDAVPNAIPGGIVDPSTLGVGSFNFKYEVTNPTCPSDEESVTLTVNETPYAGQVSSGPGQSRSNPLKLCVTNSNTDLFPLINGNGAVTPDGDGKWYLGSTGELVEDPRIFGDRFLDATQWGVAPPTARLQLELIYRVEDETGECNPDQVRVYVDLYTEPYVEPTVVDTSVCEDDPIIVLDNLIDDSFRTSGQWSQTAGPETISNPAFFEPDDVATTGVYTFEKTFRNPDNGGQDICGTETIIVNIDFHLKPNAGADLTTDLCPDALKDLYALLPAGAGLNGTFYGPDAPTTALSPGQAAAFDFGPYENTTITFRYEILGEPGVCPDDESIQTFNVGDFANPGISNSIILCTSDAVFAMVDSLDGTPDQDGVWSPVTGITGTDHTATFDPAANAAGTYSYTYEFATTGICPAVSAVLDIQLYTEPLAGDDFAETICNVDDAKLQYGYLLADQISGGANGAVYGDGAVAADVMEEFGAIEPVANAVTDPVTGEVDVFNLGGGTYNFFYRTFNAGCVADTAFFVITVNQVGNAGRDSLFVRCSTEPNLDLSDLLSTGVDDFGTFDDVDGTGAINGLMDYNSQFIPQNVTELSPDTGFRLIYIVEVDECPSDSANIIAYVSEAPKGGIAKGGTDSLLYGCETETGLQLTDAFVPDSYTEPAGNDGALTGSWKLISGGASSLIPASVLNTVNNGPTRATYFTGADSSAFNVEEFVDLWENNTNDISFWQFLKTDRILNFVYTVRDTSIGKLKLPTYYEGFGPIPREIGCPDSSSVIQVALMPDYSERFTLEVGAGIPTKMTICESVNDFNLNLYFTELGVDNSKLDIFDIYNPAFDTISLEGIDQSLVDAGAVFSSSPTNLFIINAKQLDFTKPDPPFDGVNAYKLKLSIISGKDKNNCGEHKSAIGFDLDVEKIPDAGGIDVGNANGEFVSQYSICEESPNFDMTGVLEGTPDEYQLAHSFFAASANASGRILGKFFDMDGAVPGTYSVRYSIPTAACVNPNNGQKRFSSLLEITVEEGPNLDGFNNKVNVFEVCSDPVTNLGALFPLGNSIDQSGVFSILSGCGQIDFASNWNQAVWNRNGNSCSTVLIGYTVTKPGCVPKELQIRLNITDKPNPGVTNRDTVCVDGGLVDLIAILQENSVDAVATNGKFTSPVATTKSGIQPGGFFDPRAAGKGTHRIRYTVGDNNPCLEDSAFVILKVEGVLRTGTNGSINACVGSPMLNLFDGLQGQFDKGGTWSAVNTDYNDYLVDGELFDHRTFRNFVAQVSSVEFIYSIDALCAEDETKVTVFLTPGAVSGKADTTVFVCTELFSYELTDALGIQGTDWLPNGIWRGINGTPNPTATGRIAPENMNSGIYEYKYTVEAECGDTVLQSSTIVTVNMGQNPSPGKTTTVAHCYDRPVDLTNLFGRNGTGIWSDPNGLGGLVDEKFFDLSLTNNNALGTYEYAYSVPNVYRNCGDTSVRFTLEIRREPDAGNDTTVFYCNFDGQEFPVENLFPTRRVDAFAVEEIKGDGTIQSKGAISGGIFFPGRLDPGAYTITLTIDDTECGDDMAIANIFIQDKDDPTSIICGDFDNDGVRNGVDLDVDGDGLSNLVESTFNGVAYNPFGNDDADDLLNFQDPDFALAIGSFMQAGVVAAFDFDKDGFINALDLDSDNDLIYDIVEGFELNVARSYDGDKNGITDVVNTNGINSIALGQTNNGTAPTMTTAGIPNYLNLDSDGDGIGDIMEGRNHTNYADVTTIIFEVVDTDTDLTPDYVDTDSDDDSILDSQENEGGSLTVVINTNAGPSQNGIFTSNNIPNFRDVDADGDGIADRNEAYLSNGLATDFDGDGVPNFLDWDSDNDGISDFLEKGTPELGKNTDMTVVTSFTDSDTLPDFIDYDSDGDLILDAIERGDIALGQDPVDTDGDGVQDYLSWDADGDHIADRMESGIVAGVVRDRDADGRFDFQDVDADGDGYLDMYESINDTIVPDTIRAFMFIDFDFDGTPDYLDFDSDDDGIFDRYEVKDHDGNITNSPFDADEDGDADFHDYDSDEDGLPDEQERGVGTEGATTAPRDSDENGTYDFRSIDADGDGVLDRLEGDGDCDGDGIENYRDAGDRCKIEAFIPEGFSPNGDRVNDFFVIPDAQFFPNNSLKVYNRWGALVYEMKGYNNTWDGTNDGEVLPDGTYFYTFDLGLEQEALTGFVYISATTN